MDRDPEHNAEAARVLELVVISEARKVARALPHDHDLNLSLRALDRVEQRAKESR